MGYLTENKKTLLEFFHAHADRSFTLEELCNQLPMIAKSSLYRLCSALEKEGTIRPLEVEGRKVRYQYLSCSCHSGHLHLKCKQCGAYIHLDAATSVRLEQLVSDDAGFSVSDETLLLGTCKACQKKEKE